MSNVYSLSDLRDALDKEFAPVEIEGVVLRNLMRLSKAERAKVMDAIDAVQAADEEANNEAQLDSLLNNIKTVILTVAEGNKGRTLASAIGDDLALGMKIINLWSEATQPGEAQNSPS